MIESNTDSGCTLKLPDVLDLAAAQALLAALKPKVAAGTPVWLDASAVVAMSMPCLQIVIAAIKPHGPVSVVNPSAAFVEAFTAHGLTWDHQPLPMPGAAAPAVAAPAPAAAPVAAPAMVEPAAPPPSPAAQAAAAMNGATAANGAGKRILTIDDSKTMRDMLMMTLASSGFDVLQAVDGLDGITVLEKETVDVVITDINMPKMDGYEVIQHLRKKKEFDATPILVLTTESDRDKKERARGLGATGFIVKPFNPVSLVEVIRKVSP